MQNHLKAHWEKVYATKQPHERSWTQPIPQTSLHIIRNLDLPKHAAIIDIGGGDSLLADHLLNDGFTDITVLDISAAAIAAAQQRLAEKAATVKWIVNDITTFTPERNYSLWHDRAAFHFLTSHEDISRYADTVTKCVIDYLVISTFSNIGPKKCSGLDITQYDEEKLAALFMKDFELLSCSYEDHTTPFDTLQNFIFCVFRRR